MNNQKDDMAMEVEPCVDTSRNIIMDLSEPDKNVMASGTAGSVTCSLHPLVIMNVSEHWTRERAQNPSVQRGSTQLSDLTYPYITSKLYSHRSPNWQAEG